MTIHTTNPPARTLRRDPCAPGNPPAGTQSGPKTITLTLPGSLRSKKNSRRPIIVGGKNCKRRIANIPSKTYTEWENTVRQIARMALGLSFCPLQGKIAVEAMVFYRGNRPDLSGALESVGDCLQGIVWEDDRQIESWDGSRMIHDKDNPRTVVTVREIVEG